MKTHIALLRGINVGGKNILPMKELAAHLEALKVEGVKTWLQSGNAVFRAEITPELFAAALAKEIERTRGFAPYVLVLEAEALRQAMAANPFPEAVAEPTSLHLGFLAAEPAAPDLAKLAALKKDSERFQLIGRVFYLHAPEGVGRSKLAAGAEACLGVPMTARNWRTVEKVLAMAAGGA